MPTDNNLAERIAEMKAAAEKAMPGPWGWTYHSDRHYGVIALESETAKADVLLCTGDSDHSWGDISEANADFIARANPASVLALIAHVEQLEQEVAELKQFQRPIIVADLTVDEGAE